MFCGYFCPFGTLARIAEGLLERLPFQPPRFDVPTDSYLRYGILALGVLIGSLWSQTLLYLFLPYVLVQQSLYGMWLMGGGGAALGALLGLLAAGILFGPTIFCKTVCPTGAALALGGRARIVRLKLVQRSDCGKGCDLCDRGCWLSLQPSTGDAGPDCDVCLRCTEVCPTNNLKVTAEKPRFVQTVVLGALLLSPTLSACTAADASPNQPQDSNYNPRLVFEAHRKVEGVDIKLSVVDLRGVRLEMDTTEELQGAEISVYLARGRRGPVDELGKMGPREIYTGPLEVSILDEDGAIKEVASFDAPNQPISTPNRSVYRQRLTSVPVPADGVRISAVSGWFSQDHIWRIPSPNSGSDPSRALGHGLAAFLLFGGAICIAIAMGNKTPPTPKLDQG